MCVCGGLHGAMCAVVCGTETGATKRERGHTRAHTRTVVAVPFDTESSIVSRLAIIGAKANANKNASASAVLAALAYTP